ncbi:MAG: transposase [Bacteroidota bacterium]
MTYEKSEKKPLDANYKAIYCDAVYTNLQLANSYSKEAVHITYSVKDDNIRELFLLEVVNPTENSKVWRESLHKLRKRGVEQVDLIVSDSIPPFF